MHKTGRHKSRAATAQMPLALKGLLLIFALCVVVRVISALGADTASKDYMTGLVSNNNIIESILNFELGSSGKADKDVSLASVILDTSILAGSSEAEADEDLPQAASASTEASPESSSAGATTVNPADSWLYYHEGTSPSPSSVPKVITAPTQPTSPDSIAVDNKTDFTVDVDALLKKPLKLSLSSKDPSVLIIHTHGSEAYTASGQDQYVASDPFRTQNKNQSVIRIGAELTEVFNKAGIIAIHDTGIYDYPSYNGSYNRSYDVMKSYLKKYPSIKMIIDLHRDDIEASDGSVYRTIATIGDTTCSQLFMLVGTKQNPNWQENFKLALHIQKEMNTLYPTLAKPIKLSGANYNAQATLGSMIVEIGTTGNTLQESLAAARYFADATSKVLLELTK